MLLRLFLLLGSFLLTTVPSFSQSSQLLYRQVCDSIIARFNRDEFKAIYQLADTSFSRTISENKLVTYLKSNRNSGNIIRVVSQQEARGGVLYHLEFEVRDMNMFLKVTLEGKFSSFGLSSVPVSLFTTPPSIASSNALKTDLDQAIDSLVRDYFRDPRAVGLSIGLIKDGRPFMYHYGEIKKESGKLPTPITGYEIGSVTKTFTTLLLAQAVTEKKVTLSDDIRRYLPRDYPNLQFGNQPVTLQDLANHTARLPPMPPNIGDQPGYNPSAPEANYDSSLFYGALHAVKLDTLPGYKFDYSNWGMAILGHIVERVYHRPYDQLLKQYITSPLGMNQTSYHQVDEDKKQMALPYTENGKEFSFQAESFLGPAGDIHSNLADMMRYLQAQISEKDPAIRLTHQPTRNNIGLGWGVRNTGSYWDIQHNGSTPGFTTHISAFPELGNGCVILANSKANMGKLILGTQAILKRKK